GEPPPGAVGTIEAMLSAVDYRGDASDTAVASTGGATLGYRFWRERARRSQEIFRTDGALCACAGTLSPPPQDSPPAEPLYRRLIAASADQGPADLAAAFADLDGAFGAACWDETRRRLSLLRDPFGVRSLYYVEQKGTLYFATELKQLLAVAGLELELDY